ncbi:cadherin-like domain-containing protein [Roseiconus lacunae]|uniref:cadherin-like domain-containing protein n=1 Tax=Roseiconus lacunae TaxID=2605694 RepID=UPI001E4993FE|nr:cadherin-like domain-containing protein [Roseiconus lacunae]MCD0459664.1 Ig-like domain-containing protein [Roseiconus lacunae]
MPVHSRRRKRSLRIEGLEVRRVLAVNPYSLDLDAVGTVDLFAPDGGGSVQDFFVDHPLSIGGIITSRNQPGTNNRPPNVGAVSFASNEGEVLNEAAPGLLQNASDPEGTPVRVSAIASQSAFGATLFGNADGSFTYDSSTSVLLKQLKPGQTSVDTFEFVVEDADGGQTVSSASVTVSGKNTAPALSNNGGGTVSEGANSAITPQQLRFTDPDDAPNELTFTVLVAPSHGALKFSDDLATTIHSFTQQDIDVGRVLYVHNGDESGADSFQFQLADGNEDGVTPTTGTFSFTVTAVDDAPSNSGSLPASATFNEDESGALDLSSVSFSDADGGSSTIVLDADEGKFQATDGGGVIVSGADTNQIRLTGSSSDLNTFLANPNAITYTPPINATGASADTVTMTSQSDDESRVLGSFDVNITDVADPPSNSGTLPSDITVTEDAASNVDLSGVTLADPDGDSLTLTLTASGGVLAASSGGGVTTGGSGTGTLTLSGSPSDLNTFLDTPTNIQYTGPSNVSGDDAETIAVSVNDGGAPVGLGTINVDITNVADPPSNSGSLPSDITVTEDAASNVDLSGVTLTDPDGDSLTLTLTASGGVLAASSGGGVTAGGSGTGTLTLSGSPSDLNTFLDTPTNIQYTGPSNVSGDDAETIAVSVNDGGAPVGLGSVNVDITNVADPPSNSGTLPSDITVTEDAASDVDLSGVTLTDPDGDSLTLTLTASGGVLAASSGGGVTTGGSGTGTLTLSGSPSDLNTFLDTPTNIQYTGPSNVSGDNAETIAVSVHDGGAPVGLGTINVDITNVADPPSNSGSLPSDITVTEDAASNVDLSGVTLTDPDGDSLTLTLTASGGVLAASSGGGVTTGGSGTGTLTLSGSPSDLNTFLDTPTNIQYTGPSNVSGDNAETIAVSINDGGAPVGLGTINVDITNVADPPSNTGTLPSDITVTEDAASDVDLSGVTLTDPDGDSLTLTLTASGGVLAASSGGGVTAGGSGTGTLTLSGSPSDLNTFLDTPTNIQYTGPSNVSGDNAETIAVSVNDGGAPVGLGTINVDITNVADPPSNSGTLPSDITVTEDAASNVDLSGVTLTDPDGDSLTLTLTASGGVLAASSSGGVTAGGSGTGTLTLSGSASNLNAFLDTSSNVQYTGPNNVSGDDAETIAVSVNDGGVPVGLGTINVDITNVADPPSNSGSLPSDITVTEDAASNVDLSGVTLADPDGDSLTLTLTASGGVLAASSGGGVTVGGSGTGTLTLSGSPSDLNTFLDTTTNIQYTGPSNVSGDDAETIAVSINDGGAPVGLGTINVDITNVADPPGNSGSLPSDIVATKNTPSNVPLGSVELFDADGDPLTLDLVVSSGTLNASSGGGVTVSGAGSATIQLAGTIGDLNAFLNTVTNIQYTGATDVTGDNVATMTVSVGDGNSTIGLGVVNIDVVDGSDPPSNSGTLPSQITVIEETASDVDFSAVTLTDPNGDNLTLTLTASAGILTAASVGGVTAGGSGTGVLTLSGSPASLNTYLDTTSNIQYIGPIDVVGDDVATISVTVDDGAAPVSLGSVNIDITNIADPPSNSGTLPSDITVTEDAASNVDLSGVTLADPDGDSLTLTLTASGGVLAASSGGGVTAGGSGTGTLTLSGSASNLNAFLDTSSNVQYTGPNNVSGDDAETIAVSVNDGGAPVGLGTINVDITNVADPPSNSGTLPSDITVTEDAASNVDLSGVTLADPDGDSLTLTFTASGGALAASSSGGVTAGGSGTGTLTLSGSPSDLNTFLDTTTNIQYTGPSNVFGDDAATVAVSVNDGGAPVGLGTINVDITNVADPPSNSGSLPSDITVTEDAASNVDLSGVTLADPDGDSLTLTLTASGGALAASSGGGVTAGGSGTGTLTLSGSPSDLNTFLDTTTNIQCTGPSNVFGDDAATVAVSVNDGGAPVGLGTINVDITNVADPPSNSGSLPSDLAVTEDVASNVDLSAVTLTDPDGDSLTLTLTASSGILAASSGAGVTVGGSGSDTLTLAGAPADLNGFLGVATNILFTGPTNLAGDDAATLSVSVNDGGGPIVLGTLNLDISAVNDDPVNVGVFPSNLSIVEDLTSNLDLSSITILDADVGGGLLRVTLTSTNGTLTSLSSGGVTVGGSGTNVLTLLGTLADLNAFLDVTSNIQLLGDLNLAGDDADVLSVVVNDLGNTGSGGGSDISLGNINIDIAAVNDDPTNVGSLPLDLSLVTGLLGGIDLSSLEIADVDVANGLLTVTLSAVASDLFASDSGGVTVGGSGSDTLTLTGTLANLNAYLDVTTNLGLFPGLGLLGEDVDLLTVTVNDGGQSGSGGGTDVVLGLINIDVLPVAAPLVSIASEEQLNIPVVLDNPALPDHEAPLERNRSITGGLEPDNVDELFGRFGPWNDREFVPTLF